ncbi:MAG TPA: glycosyl hydrolase family 18 protein [Micromonosporaceae bacterium]
MAVTALGACSSGQRPALPAHMFAPYFQTYTGASLAAATASSGAKFATMAFLQTERPGSCDVFWNGDPATPVASAMYGVDIAKIRAHGGDVVPSFGGFSADHTGTDIADSCASVDRVAEAYEHVISTYDVTRVDLDVEDISLGNAAGIDRRNRAVRKVEQWAASNGRTVQFVYTIPTEPDGPSQTAVEVLANAVANHARVDIVNIMTFDYYDGLRHDMAGDTESAAGALVATLRKLYPSRSTDRLRQMVGVTEMIGRDDYGGRGATGPPEIFTLADAQTVTAWAARNHIAELSFWALGRDNGRCPGTSGDGGCSGIVQTDGQFARIMSAFGRGS